MKNSRLKTRRNYIVDIKCMHQLRFRNHKKRNFRTFLREKLSKNNQNF